MSKEIWKTVLVPLDNHINIGIKCSKAISTRRWKLTWMGTMVLIFSFVVFRALFSRLRIFGNQSTNLLLTKNTNGVKTDTSLNANNMHNAQCKAMWCDAFSIFVRVVTSVILMKVLREFFFFVFFFCYQQSTVEQCNIQIKF